MIIWFIFSLLLAFLKDHETLKTALIGYSIFQNVLFLTFYSISDEKNA